MSPSQVVQALAIGVVVISLIPCPGHVPCGHNLGEAGR